MSFTSPADAAVASRPQIRQILDDIAKTGNRAGEVIALTRGETLKNGITVQTQLADDPPTVHGDRVQLQHVMLNLIVNAIEAMS